MRDLTLFDLYVRVITTILPSQLPSRDPKKTLYVELQNQHL